MPDLYKPQNLSDLIETLTTLTELMYLSHKIHDEEQFNLAYEHAKRLSLLARDLLKQLKANN